MSLLFLGPLPPPIHGFSSINQAMLERLQDKSAVEIFDRTKNNARSDRHSTSLSRIICWIRLINSFRKHSSKETTGLYVGLSGGWGQLLDLPFFLIARTRRTPTVIHHHSYAYVNRFSSLSWTVFMIAKDCDHICLCNDMADKLQELYNIIPGRISVISNAAFLTSFGPAASTKDVFQNENRNSIVVGFISNITAEKGIFDFFEAVDAMRKKLPEVSGMVAGPVQSKQIEAKFHNELMDRPWIRYLGPVYGEQKASFFAAIDVLLFPSRYTNEAEPVTILEAQSYGVTVVAATRGCIAEMLESNSDCHACATTSFKLRAVNCVQRLNRLTKTERLSARQHRAQAAHLKALDMDSRLSKLLDRLYQ